MATDDSSKRTPLNSLGKPEIRNTRTRLGQESIPRLETHNQSSKESNPASTRSQNTTHKKHQHISLQKRKSPSRPSITSPTTHTATSQLARSTHSIERKPSPNNKLINPQTKTGKTGKSSSRLVPENDGNTRPSKRGNTTSLKKAPRSKSGKAISSESRGGLPLPPAVRIANDGSTARLLSPAAAVAAAAKNRAAESARAKPQPRSRFDSMQPGRQFTVGNIGANGLITLRYEACFWYRLLATDTRLVQWFDLLKKSNDNDNLCIHLAMSFHLPNKISLHLRCEDETALLARKAYFRAPSHNRNTVDQVLNELRIQAQRQEKLRDIFDRIHFRPWTNDLVERR